MPTKPEFRWGTITEARAAGFEDLLFLNWEELEHHKDVSPLDVNWPAYLAYEKAGHYKLGLLRLDGELIGYSGFFVQPPLHHRSTLWAVNDMVYLAPEHRRGLTGAYLIREAERLLKAMGARVIMYGAKPDHNLDSKRDRDSVSLLLQKLGYGAFEHTWSKAL